MNQDLSEIPNFAKEWAHKRIVQHTTRGGELLDSDIETVTEWLWSLPDNRPKMPGKLYKITWEQAVIASRKWSEHEHNKGRVHGDPYAITLVLECKDGYRWVEVMTPAGLDYEGAMMKNCIWKGDYDNGNRGIIFSLRNARNIPCCTVEWRSWESTVNQIRSRHNSHPPQKYISYIKQLFNYLQPVGGNGLYNSGHAYVQINDNCPAVHHYTSFQDGDVIKGDILFCDYSDTVFLNKRIRIIGDLHIIDCCEFIIGEDVVVEGDIYIRESEPESQFWTIVISCNITGHLIIAAHPKVRFTDTMRIGDALVINQTQLDTIPSLKVVRWILINNRLIPTQVRIRIDLKRKMRSWRDAIVNTLKAFIIITLD